MERLINVTDETRIELPVLKGKRILLRPPLDSDKQDRIAVGRDSEFRRMVGADALTDLSLTMPEVERWLARVSQEPPWWIIEIEGHCIGETRLHSVDWKNRRARYAIGIFSRAHRNRGFGTEATSLVLQYAFETLQLHRVDLHVLAFNQRAIACYRKCGFVPEGIEREGAFMDGKWQSDVQMSILEQEYGRLGERS